jgi:hypothetical protein
MRFTIATMIWHLSPTESSKSKEYFASALIKAAANQVAGQVINELKAKQLAAEEEAKKAAEIQSEALTEASPSGLQQ